MYVNKIDIDIDNIFHCNCKIKDKNILQHTFIFFIVKSHDGPTI